MALGQRSPWTTVPWMTVSTVSPQLVKWQLFEDISSYKRRSKENKFRQLYEEGLPMNLLTISKITLCLTFIRYVGKTNDLILEQSLGYRQEKSC